MRKCKWSAKTLLLAFVCTVWFSSCQKDDEANGDYVGTWAATETVTSNGLSLQAKDIITFSENSFTDVLQIVNPLTGTGGFVDYIKLSGSVSVSGSTMTMKIAEVGIVNFDLTTGLPTGTMTTYRAGSSEYNELLAEVGQQESFQSKYSISGNKMTIKTDLNNDGDYDDASETTVYTRQ